MSLGEVAEFAEEYSAQVRSMKRPAKEEINALTMVAADFVENPAFALAVVQVLERAVAELMNELKLIPLYVLDSILKNVQPRSVYAELASRNLTRVMATAFMAVDNNLKPKFIKLLKTWDENKIFPDAKIVEVRDTMTLMLTNGGVFPEHLQYGGGQGPQTGAHTHMAQGPMDVETPYMGAHNSYHNQPQHGGSGALSSVSQHHPANAHAPHQRPSKSPQPVDVPQESSGPRILCPKELVSRDVSDVIARLYDARPYISKHDAKRFREKQALEQHLDALFIKNKAKRERTGVQERLWFRQVEEWSKAQDVTLLTETPKDAANAMDVDAPTQDKENVVVVCSEWGSGVKCGACHEVLKKTWDNDSDAWVFRGVICLEASSTGRPSLVHQKCHQGSASLPS
eukprot:Tamp_06959.p1 GENE.Tamp_06959~~Tamp_06959.p1  ORF type:complete len:399 (+),score=96.67 Tamp_06959:304-1500(+)